MITITAKPDNKLLFSLEVQRDKEKMTSILDNNIGLFYDQFKSFVPEKKLDTGVYEKKTLEELTNEEKFVLFEQVFLQFVNNNSNQYLAKKAIEEQNELLKVEQDSIKI